MCCFRTRRAGRDVADSEQHGNLWLWVSTDGEIVAAAQHTPPYGAYVSPAPADAVVTLAHSAESANTRICERMRGRLTQHLLAIPGNRCMLFTDLANHTSNHIYQAIGYRKSGDAAEIRFGGTSGT